MQTLLISKQNLRIDIGVIELFLRVWRAKSTIRKAQLKLMRTKDCIIAGLLLPTFLFSILWLCSGPSERHQTGRSWRVVGKCNLKTDRFSVRNQRQHCMYFIKLMISAIFIRIAVKGRKCGVFYKWEDCLAIECGQFWSSSLLNWCWQFRRGTVIVECPYRLMYFLVLFGVRLLSGVIYRLDLV